MSQVAAIQCNLRIFPLRLMPGMDIKSSLMDFVRQNKLKAAFVVTCCGSVQKATLRYATDKNGKELVETHDKCFEITSLVGTICSDGAHLHVTLGDSCGSTVSGHVVDNLVVQTTAEIILGEASGANFFRQFDALTGWPELIIKPDV